LENSPKYTISIEDIYSTILSGAFHNLGFYFEDELRKEKSITTPHEISAMIFNEIGRELGLSDDIITATSYALASMGKPPERNVVIGNETVTIPTYQDHVAHNVVQYEKNGPETPIRMFLTAFDQIETPQKINLLMSPIVRDDAEQPQTLFEKIHAAYNDAKSNTNHVFENEMQTPFRHFQNIVDAITEGSISDATSQNNIPSWVTFLKEIEPSIDEEKIKAILEALPEETLNKWNPVFGIMMKEYYLFQQNKNLEPYGYKQEIQDYFDTVSRTTGHLMTPKTLLEPESARKLYDIDVITKDKALYFLSNEYCYPALIITKVPEGFLVFTQRDAQNILSKSVAERPEINSKEWLNLFSQNDLYGIKVSDTDMIRIINQTTSLQELAKSSEKIYIGHKQKGRIFSGDPSGYTDTIVYHVTTTPDKVIQSLPDSAFNFEQTNDKFWISGLSKMQLSNQDEYGITFRNPLTPWLQFGIRGKTNGDLILTNLITLEEIASLNNASNLTSEGRQEIAKYIEGLDTQKAQKIKSRYESLIEKPLQGVSSSQYYEPSDKNIFIDTFNEGMKKIIEGQISNETLHQTSTALKKARLSPLLGNAMSFDSIPTNEKNIVYRKEGIEVTGNLVAVSASGDIIMQTESNTENAIVVAMPKDEVTLPYDKQPIERTISEIEEAAKEINKWNNGSGKIKDVAKFLTNWDTIMITQRPDKNGREELKQCVFDCSLFKAKTPPFTITSNSLFEKCIGTDIGNNIKRTLNGDYMATNGQILLLVDKTKGYGIDATIQPSGIMSVITTINNFSTPIKISEAQKMVIGAEAWNSAIQSPEFAKQITIDIGNEHNRVDAGNLEKALAALKNLGYNEVRLGHNNDNGAIMVRPVTNERNDMTCVVIHASFLRNKSQSLGTITVEKDQAYIDSTVKTYSALLGDRDYATPKRNNEKKLLQNYFSKAKIISPDEQRSITKIYVSLLSKYEKQLERVMALDKILSKIHTDHVLKNVLKPKDVVDNENYLTTISRAFPSSSQGRVFKKIIEEISPIFQNSKSPPTPQKTTEDLMEGINIKLREELEKTTIAYNKIMTAEKIMREGLPVIFESAILNNRNDIYLKTCEIAQIAKAERVKLNSVEHAAEIIPQKDKATPTAAPINEKPHEKDDKTNAPSLFDL